MVRAASYDEDLPDRLRGVIVAAAGPPTPDELAREESILVAFRAAHRAPVAERRRPSMIKSALAKLLTLKVAAAAAAVTAAGGVALAATGTIPNPLQAPAPATTPADRPAGGAGESNGSPEPSQYGLCHAYVSGATDNPGRAADSPAFQALADAAGGAENLDAYCDEVIAEGPGEGQPPVAPGMRPTEVPTGAPAGVSSGRPSTVPTGPPDGIPSAPVTPPTPRR